MNSLDPEAICGASTQNQIYTPVERLDGVYETRNVSEKWMHLSRYHMCARRLKTLANRVEKAQQRPLQILDIACGLGYGSKILANSLGAQIKAIDLSPEALEYAAKNHAHPNVELIQGTVLEIPAQNESFDVVVCYETIEHVDLEQAFLALREFWRILRPGGVLYISTPNRYFTFLLQLMGMKNEFHFYEFRPEQLERFLTQHGFKVRARFGQTLAFPITYYLVRAGKLSPRLFFPKRQLPASLCMIAIFECEKSNR